MHCNMKNHLFDTLGHNRYLGERKWEKSEGEKKKKRDDEKICATK